MSEPPNVPDVGEGLSERCVEFCPRRARCEACFGRGGLRRGRGGWFEGRGDVADDEWEVHRERAWVHPENVSRRKERSSRSARLFFSVLPRRMNRKKEKQTNRRSSISREGSVFNILITGFVASSRDPTTLSFVSCLRPPRFEISEKKL